MPIGDWRWKVDHRKCAVLLSVIVTPSPEPTLGLTPMTPWDQLLVDLKDRMVPTY